MGLFDTVVCDYPLSDPRHQDLEFQTKDLDCLMQRYTITRDGRLLKHPSRGFFGTERPRLEEDVELPIHGDISIYDVDPDKDGGLVEYRVRFTHGCVEWVRREQEGQAAGESVPPPGSGPVEPPGGLVPDVMGRPLTAAEFSAHTPEKLELVDGRIPGDRDLLLLLLTSFGLRRAAALVGYESWERALPADEGPRGLP